MAAVDLCSFNHGLGIYIRILSLAGALEKNNQIKMPNPWLNEHKSMAAMNYFLNIVRFGEKLNLVFKSILKGK